MPRWLSVAVWAAFVGLGFVGAFYVAWHSVSAPGYVTVPLALGFVGFLAWLTRHVVRLSQWSTVQPEARSARTLIPILVLGVALRVAWVAAFPPEQFSDGADYVRLAKGIVATGEYTDYYPGTDRTLRAFRPPGYPAFLAPFYAALGDRPWIPLFTNLLLYLGSAFLLFDLGSRFSGPRAGRLAALLLTVWPASILVAGLARSETLSLFLYLALFACWLRVMEGRSRWVAVLGLAGALAALVRPTLLPLPVLLIVFAAFLRPFRVRNLAHAGVASVVMLALIAPWTLRNEQVLGGFVPISTNGGDVFYRANNPLAGGGFSERGELDPWQYATGEISWNQAGFRLGKEWIKNHPVAFLRLGIEKQAILLGTDTFGPYHGMQRGCGIDDWRYDAALAVCNLWWAGFWLLVVLGAVRVRNSFVRTPAGVALVLMVFVLVAAHSIFESQPRHHEPFFGHLALLAAFLFHPPARSPVNRKETSCS